MNDRKQALDNFSQQMLNSAINGINEAVASKQKEVNYWKNQAQLTNEQLLRMLGQKIATGEIESDYRDDGQDRGAEYLYLKDKAGKWVLSMAIESGQIELKTKLKEEVNHA